MADATKEVYILADALPDEMERVRELSQFYASQPDGAGLAGVFLMNLALEHSEKAACEQDVVEMIRAYVELKEFDGD